jgi:prolyl oligopeptidase
MEDVDADETRAWVTAQAELSSSLLDAVAGRDAYRARLEALWVRDRKGAIKHAGDHYFYTHHVALEDQPVLMVADALGAEGRVLVDPNTYEHTASISEFAPSPDGRWLAFGIADAGGDWTTWTIRDAHTGEDLPEVITTRYAGVTWLPDSSGFFYTQYLDSAEGGRLTVVVTRHTLGTPATDDVAIYRDPDPSMLFTLRMAPSGDVLAIHAARGTGRTNDLYLLDVTDPMAVPVPAVVGHDASFLFLDHDVRDGARVLRLATNFEAPRGRLVTLVEGAHPDEAVTLVAEGPDPHDEVHFIGGRLVVLALRDATHQIRVHGLDGTLVHTIDLPDPSTIVGLHESSQTTVYFLATGFRSPASVYSLDVVSGAVELVHRARADFDPELVAVTQVFYPSADGTQVPMFLVHRRDVVPDGDRPTQLYGYGGFKIALTPRFWPDAIPFIEDGGVFAVANLRGGGEYGRTWHEGGALGVKQNTFDDFIAAAEWLIAEGWTRPAKLAIRGRSNGGLLVGACMVQRPELFGAAIPRVGVLDMLRFHRWTIGWAWISDYGDPDDPAMFEVLRSYSPYHNAVPAAYPATLVATADHDDRVVPIHSFKFGAALQHAQQGDRPVLVRIQTQAGHGMGTPVAAQIDEWVDQWAFLRLALGD